MQRWQLVPVRKHRSRLASLQHMVRHHLFPGNFRERLDDCLAFNGATIARSPNEIPLYFATPQDVAAAPITAVTHFLSFYQLRSRARIPVCKISRSKWLTREIGKHPFVIVPNKRPKFLDHNRTICGSDRSLVRPCVASSAASSNFGSNFVGSMNDLQA